MNVQDILKTEKILKGHPEDTLSSALRTISSAHDAVFVFDDANTFMGVINPYYTLVKTTYTWNTKLKHCLYNPPKVYINQPFQEVVRLMVESRLHYLPVFDKEGGSFMGITSARKLLHVLGKLSLFHMTNKAFLETKEGPLVALKKNDTVAKAIELFRSERVSKLVVIDDAFKLIGIFTYYNLIAALMAPLKKEHASEGDDEIMPQRNQTITPYISTTVETMTEDQFLDESLSEMLTKNIGSIVVTNLEGIAKGIITIRDFMNFLKEEEPKRIVELTTQHLSPANKQKLIDYMPILERWFDKIVDLHSVRLVVKEEKNGALFKVSLHLIPVKGDPLVLTEENHHLEGVLNKIKKEEMTIINRKENYVK